MDVLEIDPPTLKSRLDSGEQLVILDIREPWEIEKAPFPDAECIPMSQIQSELGAIRQWSRSWPLVVLCHHGVRSLRTAKWLREQGVPAVGLSGGIDLWSTQVASDIPRY
jgi:rhodanese-related sulfurtransferase